MDDEQQQERMSDDAASAVRLARRASGEPSLDAAASEALPHSTVEPSLTDFEVGALPA